MKKKLYVFILLLVIGFASVTTALVIGGNTFIAANETDYSIFFSEAVLDDVDKTNVVIDDTRQVINFETNNLTLEGEKSILEYEVTNNSKQYDATVKINCMVSDERILDFIDLKYSIDKEIISAGNKANGTITVELTKAFADDINFNNNLTCQIETEAQERTSIVEEGIQPRIYYTYGFLVDDDNEPIKNAIVTVYDKEEATYAVTDDRGMYIITNLSSGEYDLYVVENMSLEEVKEKAKEEVISISTQKNSFHTKAASLTLENNHLKYGKVVAGEPVIHDLTFDTNGGSTESFTSKVIEGQGVGYLPSTIHESLVFKNWQDSGEEINENTVINEERTLLANYGEGVAKIGEKNFKTINLAIDYANETEETTIEVINDNSLTNNIDNSKNITLNLNENNVNFKKYNITNSGNLTIKNGNIKAEGLNVLTNDGTLNLVDNLNIEHESSKDNKEVVNTLINNKGKKMNINNSTINTSLNSFVLKQSMISNYGSITTNNSNFNSKDAVMFLYENSTFDMNNSTANYHSLIEVGAFFQVYGILNFDESNLLTGENNEKASGLISIYANGTGTLKSGTLDNTNGKSNLITSVENSTLNIGENDKKLKFIGNETNNYTLYSRGNLNILDGTITSENTKFLIGTFGNFIIGTETTIPKLNSVDGRILDVRAGTDNKIINAELSNSNSSTISVSEGAKLTIDDVKLTQSSSTTTNRSMNVYGELIINNGVYQIGEDNNTGYGLIELRSTGSLTINSGTFDNTYGKSNSAYTEAGSTLNIGDNSKDVKFIGNGTNNYIISSRGTLNILSGNVVAEKGFFIGNNGVLTVGTEETTPTITGATGYTIFEIRTNNDNNKITNGNLIAQNSKAINVYANAKLTIDNANIVQSNSTSVVRIIDNAGKLIINNGVYQIGEDNNTGYGLIELRSTGSLTINSGTFDNTYGKSNSTYTEAGSTLNIGEDNKEIKFISNELNYYNIFSFGEINILNGKIISDKGPFISSNGKIVIGTSSTIPQITSENYQILNVNKGTENKIINAVFNNSNSCINVATDTKLTIENGIFNTHARLLTVSGEANIDGGEFINTATDNNTIYINETGTLNIGKNEQNTISIANVTTEYFPPIANHGNLNIYSGTIMVNNTNLIVQRKAPTPEEEELLPEEERVNYAATTKIYGGILENNSSNSTIAITAGRLEMSGGEVVNNGTGNTIYNSGGTAIQTGGTSLNNYGVTIE